MDAATVNLIAHPENTVVNTAKAVEKGSMIVYSITEGAVKATAVGIGIGEGNGDGLGVMGTLEAVTNARKDVLTIVAMAENKGLAEKLDKALEGDAARLDGALNEASGIIQTSDGVAEGDISKVNLYQGSETDNAMGGYAAAYDQNGKEIYFNTQGTDISKGGDIITSLFWEAQRKDNTTNGLNLNSDQQLTLASSRGEQAGNLWNRFSETANTTSNVGGVINWNNANAGSSTLINGTEKANSLKTGEGSEVVPRKITLADSKVISTLLINGQYANAAAYCTSVSLEDEPVTTNTSNKKMDIPIVDVIKSGGVEHTVSTVGSLGAEISVNEYKHYSLEIDPKDIMNSSFNVETTQFVAGVDKNKLMGLGYTLSATIGISLGRFDSTEAGLAAFRGKGEEANVSIPVLSLSLGKSNLNPNGNYWRTTSMGFDIVPGVIVNCGPTNTIIPEILQSETIKTTYSLDR